ncbi:reverse transcriptase domain-containing protein [Tanacetum coccineum]
MPQEGLAIIESKSKVRYSRSRANDSRVSTDAPLSNSSPSNNSFDIQQLAASLEDKMTIKMKQMMNEMKALVVTTPAPIKAVEEVVLGFFDSIAYNNPSPYFDPIVSTSSERPKDEIPEVELKELPPHLEYAFLEKNNKLPVIISKDLSQDEKTSLINVLKNQKQAIAWKLSDIRGIDPEFCSHKILLEDDYEPSVQHHRRVNLKIHDVIKKEVEKLLDAGLIYPILDSPWVSPVHCVPKKGGMTVVINEGNELGIFQIPIVPKDQEKTTLHVPILTFAYRRMPSRLSMATRELSTLQMAIFSRPCIEKRWKSFMDDLQFFKILFPHIAILAFQTLKKKVHQEPISHCSEWDKGAAYEIMCDASDYAIGAVLGQRIEKHFRPIHYASKTMTEVESNYTTTEKEMLAVV